MSGNPSGDEAVAVFPSSAVFSAGRLQRLGGVDVTELAERFGTPLYVVDRAELVGRMRAYRRAFGDGVDVIYACKALCVVGVAQLAAGEGLWLDVASAGELHTALRAGAPADRLVFHGNNKSEGELTYAVRSGVGRIVGDNLTELERLERIAERSGRAVAVLLRVTPGVEAGQHRFIRTGGDDSKFGFVLSKGLAHTAIAAALESRWLDLRGLHCHIGSQVFAPEAYEAAAETMVGLLADVREQHGVMLGQLNLGGGLGVAYTADDRPLDLSVYASRLCAAVAAACEAQGLPVPRLAVEPGRSIVAPAGVTLYTVGTVKAIPGVRTYVSVDGGMSDNPRPAVYGSRYTVAAAGTAPGAMSVGDVGLERVTVVGKHCESGDVLAHDVELPADLTAGDLVAFGATGAYNFSMASNYNRLPRPAMVLVTDGQAHELVRRETLDDVVANDVALPAVAL